MAEDLQTHGKDGHPLISVIIVAGPNRRDSLFRCIESIAQSTYRHHEIIVVNNSCQPALLEEVRRAFPEVKTIEMVINTGVYGFNVGFANARGDYLLGIDDDCALRPDTLQQIKSGFEKRPKKVGVISANIYNPIDQQCCVQSLVDQNIEKLCCFADGASAIKRQVFQRAGYYDEAFFIMHHGADLALRILDAGYEIHFDKAVVIDHYEKRGGFRKIFAFLNLRNLVWLTVKHFSLKFFPLLIARNLLSFLALPLKHKTLMASVYGLAGYVMGWLTVGSALRKRRVVSRAVQARFVRHFVFNEHPQD